MNFLPTPAPQYASDVLPTHHAPHTHHAHNPIQPAGQPSMFPAHMSHTQTSADGRNGGRTDHVVSYHSQPHNHTMFEQNNIIVPPKNKEELEQKKATFIVVDSRSRNHTDYPHPNQYSIPLSNEIRDVESIQMISYDIPKPQFPIRATNNMFYYTVTSPSLVVSPDGSVSVNLNKSTNTQSFAIDPGYYEDTLYDYVPTPTVTNGVLDFKTEIDTYVDTTTFKQDMFSVAFEKKLNEKTNTTCVMYIEEHSQQYTLLTNFSSPTADAGSECDDVSFFHPFFEGCKEFYGATTMEKVNVCKPTTRTCEDDAPAPVYSYEKCGKKQSTYLKNSIGEIIGHPRVDSRLQISGRGGNLAVDAATLTGVGSRFATELRKGDWLFVYDYLHNVQRRIHIHEVISDTECTIDCNGDGTGVAPGAFESAFMWVGRLTFPWARNLNADNYIAMYINNATTLQSYTQAIDRSFFLVPGVSQFYEIKQYLPYKRFSPTLGKLDKLDILFRNPDNSLYDFKGRNHVLMFKVIHYRQNISYGDF